MTTTVRSVPVAWATVLATLLCTVPAWSNGDLFFEAQEIPGKPEYVIFGNVKNETGVYIEDAVVTVIVKEPRLTYTAETGILGRFRTLDIGRAIRGLGYDVDPAQIQVTVDHPGYEVTKRFYRGRRDQNSGAIEFNFVMTEKAK